MISISDRNVTKEIFLAALDCPVIGWLLRHGELQDVSSLGDEFRMEQGMEIGRRARLLFPEGVLVLEKSPLMAERHTGILLSDPGIGTIFEAFFQYGSFAARADVLVRTDEKWHMLEVKSAANDKKEFIDDMAYTTFVLRGAGLDVVKTSLVIVSKEYRLGMPNEALFTVIDHTDRVMEKAQELQGIREHIDEVTGRGERPEAQVRIECRKCPRFREHLSGGGENHVFDIPRLSRRKFDELRERGIEIIEDIPADFPLTANQERVRSSVSSGEIYIGDNLGAELDRIIWPALYLDFETFMTAIPVYPDTAPYTQIPFQYSIHRCSDVGVIDEHLEYLAEAGEDGRRELAEGLIRDLEGEGSILIYTPFERRIVRELAELFPDLADRLNLLLYRMVDLEAIIRKNFYHPDFHGSTSIKKTLPALVPELTYEGMAIGEGDSAMAHFAFMAWGRYGPEKMATVRGDLLEYCKLDTLAMVKLHERLAEYVDGK